MTPTEANYGKGLDLPAEKAQEMLANVRIHWEGKPIPNRTELYDDARS